MIVLSSVEYEGLARGISEELGVEYMQIETRRFPDGELYVRVPTEVKGKECVYVQTAQKNIELVEVFLVLDALRDYGAKTITCVVPYIAYSRQDKRFKEGEAMSAKTTLKLINSLCDRIITVNAHYLDSEGKTEIYGVKIENLDAFPVLAEYFSEKNKNKNKIVVAPDKGSLKYARKASEVIGCDFGNIEKKRFGDEEVKMDLNGLDVSGKSVIILDDIISTGGTIVNAAKLLKKAGAERIYVGCVHGIFAKGMDRINAVVDEVVCTDTIITEGSKISIAKLIADAI